MKKVAWLLILLVGCIDPYLPPEIKSAGAILVIDGHIDFNNISTIKNVLLFFLGASATG